MFELNPALAAPIAETFEEFEVLAKTCAHQARFLLLVASEAERAAVEMWRIAKEHQRAAAELNGGYPSGYRGRTVHVELDTPISVPRPRSLNTILRSAKRVQDGLNPGRPQAA